MWKTLGTKPSTPEDSTGLVQLLVEVTLIDLEAGDIQRFGQPDVALLACLVRCRAESFDPVRHLS
jgi:hypothetical protein